MPLKHTLKANIEGTIQLDLFTAAIEAGATLDELYKWQTGVYPGWFKAQVFVWYQRQIQYKSHAKDIEIEHMKKQTKS